MNEQFQPTSQMGKLLSDTRQLTFAGRRSGEGYFSRDGSQIVFQSEREPGNPFYQIYLMNLENGDVDRVSPGTGKTTCGWIHPSGGRLLFASTHLDPNSKTLQVEELAAREAGTQRRYAWDYDPHYDLFAVRLPTPDEAPRRLMDAAGYDAEASWSPDGRQIVFASNRTGSGRAQLYMMNRDGSGTERLTNDPGRSTEPAWSPDGEKLMFTSNRQGNNEIYRLRIRSEQ